MGGRGASSSNIKIMSEQEYLASKGYGEGWLSEPGRQGPSAKNYISDKQHNRQLKEFNERQNQYTEERNRYKEEYKQLVKQGKMRAPTQYERALKQSKRDPNSSATQAAKRILEKLRAKGIKK